MSDTPSISTPVVIEPTAPMMPAATTTPTPPTTVTATVTPTVVHELPVVPTGTLVDAVLPADLAAVDGAPLSAGVVVTMPVVAETPEIGAGVDATEPLDGESKKRKTRSSSSQADGGGSASGDVSGENDDEFSEDENDAAMQDVMAKMKEANEAALQAASNGQLVHRPLGGATGVGANGAGAGAAGATADRVQLYDSKRMSRVSFNSWYEFDAYFEMYMQETYQPFRMRSSCSVEAYRRNQQKVMLNNKNSRGRRIEFPDAAIHHHRIYMCTHAMKARCRGATTRPGQKYRGIGCIAKINVKISPSENPSKYMVIVTDQVVTHNHPISKEIYESYPDVLLKTMRRNQMTTALLTRQSSPKFDSPSQSQKYERAMTVLNSVGDVMARLPDDEYESQMQQLQKFYTAILPSDAAHV